MKATIHIESPVIACRRILGLPCLVRTVASLVKEGVTQIILEGPDGGVIHPLMKKYGWSRFVRQTHAKSALDKEGLRLKAEYHYDPDLVKWLVSSNAQRFDDEAGEMPENWWQKLDVGQQSLAKAEQKLLKNIRHKTEGWVAPNINKPISFWITKQLVKTSLTPNQITLANLFLAAVASLFIALPNYGLRFVGAILMYLTSIIDGCDGEVASLKCLGTRFGAWFDTVADDVANNLFFIGLFYGLYIFSGDVLYTNVGWITVVFSVGVSAVIYHQLIEKNAIGHAANFQPAWQKKASTDKTWYDWVRPIMKRDFFIAILFVLIVFDLRTLLFWLAVIATLTTFSVYLVSFVSGLTVRKNQQGHSGMTS